MKYLFIGGIADGDRINVPDDNPVWDVQREKAYKVNPGEIAIIGEIYADRQTYKAYSFGAGPYAFRVFIPADWDSADVLAALINGYRRQR
jgi:hypothetical protein